MSKMIELPKNVGSVAQNTQRRPTATGRVQLKTVSLTDEPEQAQAFGSPGSQQSPRHEVPAVVQRRLDAVFGNVQGASARPRWQPGGEEAALIHQAAARGTSGPGRPLPFLQQIQSAFGRHDVSRVQAYTGSQATEAARAMGASAYASGNKVAFSGTPSLHTAAHEAAHTVQQRAGVQLQSGIGQVDDPYERHADAVADAVVAGRSAEGLLGAQPTGGGTSPQKSVQRKLRIGQGKNDGKETSELNDVKAWFSQNKLEWDDELNPLVLDILGDKNFTLDYAGEVELFLSRLQEAKQYLDNIPDNVPEEQEEFAKRKLPGQAVPLFKPRALNLLHPNSENWLRVKFQYAIPKAPSQHGRPASQQNYGAKDKKDLQGKHLICATSAAAIVAGFVPNPENLDEIVTKSKEMALLLNKYGKQPNAMSTQEAHMVATEFSGLNNITVSNVYKVSNEEEAENLSQMGAYAKMMLKDIIDKMTVGERIYIGRQELDGVKNKNNNEFEKPFKLLKGHAYAGLKTDHGMVWFESNSGKAARDKAPHFMNPKDLPGVAQRFSYFISTPNAQS